MSGLLTLPGDVLGGISEFLFEHGIYNIPMPHYEPPYLYIQKYGCLLYLNEQSIMVREVNDFEVMTIDLCEATALDRLLEELRRRAQALAYRRWH